MPVLKSFCIYCSIGILFLFLMQSTLFPACLTLNQRRIESRRDACFPCLPRTDYTPSSWSQSEIVREGIKRILAPALLSVVGRVNINFLLLNLNSLNIIIIMLNLYQRPPPNKNHPVNKGNNVMSINISLIK